MNSKFLLVLVLLLLIPLRFVDAQPDSKEVCLQPNSYANSFSALNLSDEEYEAAKNSAPEGAKLVYLLQSPSCRYQLREYSIPAQGELVRNITVWDSTTGQTTINYDRPRANDQEYIRWFWNSNETEVVIGGYYQSVYPGSSHAQGAYHLWKLATGTSLMLRCPVKDGCIVPSYGEIFWDDVRNWLWTSSWEGVLAYDRNTGQVVRSFPNPPWDGSIGYYSGHSYQFSTDGTKVVVVFKAGSGLNDAITIWDIDHMTAAPINIEGYATRRIADADRPMSECVSTITLSPDNRYLALGDTTIRIWDLENLQPGYENRLPIYRHAGPDGRIRCLRFVDVNTIETDSADGIQSWDVQTGAAVS